MRVGYTQNMIEEAGLWLERHPADSVLVVAATKQTADQMIRWIWDRIRWKRILRENAVTRRSTNTVEFSSGGKLQVIAASPYSGRGLAVNQVFVEDRVATDLLLQAFAPCEWKGSWR